LNDEQRIKRLVGDGASGGGLPLPDALQPLLETLLDRGKVRPPELTRLVSSALSFKGERILEDFGSWKSFTDDLIEQLKYTGYVKVSEEDARYLVPTKNFIPGTSLLVIPEADIRITIYTAEERKVREELSGIIQEINIQRGHVASMGRMTQGISDLFTRLTLAIESGKLPVGSHTGRQAVGMYTEPEDEPDVMRMCVQCEQDKPQTREFYKPSRSRGVWYWNRRCRACLTPGFTQYHRKVEAREIRDTILDLIERSDGKPPSAREVMRVLEQSDDRTIRKTWDEWTAKGALPPRSTKA